MIVPPEALLRSDGPFIEYHEDSSCIRIDSEDIVAVEASLESNHIVRSAGWKNCLDPDLNVTEI